jgi:adenosylcobinamide-GDP ribazoletransferase
VRGALSFLTPFGGAQTPGPRTLDWFPLVGAVMGLALGGIWWTAGRAWGAPLSAALVVAADLALTGLLHFDGLVDSADGLLPHLDRDRRLAVMSSPEAGAFGVGVGVVVLLLRWAALSALRPSVVLLVCIWCLSRTGMAVAARTQPYARLEGGLASAFSGAPRWTPLAAGLAGSFGLACAWRLPAGVVVAGSALVAGALVVWLARRRIGGFTGDVLGAAGVVTETAGLIVAAARWS